jgi:hypothetical protein
MCLNSLSERNTSQTCEKKETDDKELNNPEHESEGLNMTTTTPILVIAGIKAPQRSP